MSWAVIAEFAKAAGDLYGAFDDFDKHTKAAEKAANGKNPYPADDKVEAQLKKLADLTKKLEQRAKSAQATRQDSKTSTSTMSTSRTKGKTLAKRSRAT